MDVHTQQVSAGRYVNAADVCGSMVWDDLCDVPPYISSVRRQLLSVNIAHDYEYWRRRFEVMHRAALRAPHISANTTVSTRTKP